MQVVPFQEILKEKFKRQSQISNLQVHANGHCVHIGKISAGCRRCFTGEQGSGIQVGNLCMAKCEYCYYDPKRCEESKPTMNNRLSDFFRSSLEEDWKPTIFAFQSTGETLSYIDELQKISLILESVGQRNKINHYIFLYTNGILATPENLKRIQDMHVTEIRFHLSASNFSKEVYRNMENAVKMGFRVTVEEPSYPAHRDKLFEMLPIMNDIGCWHLDMVECQITPHNRDAILRRYIGNEYKAFKDYYYHLYDNGLVYDIMEEVNDKKYGFSVIDCSSAVERCRHNRDQHILFNWNSIEGAFADWRYEI